MNEQKRKINFHYAIAGDTILCANDTLELTALANAKSYLWNTGDTTKSISVTSPGMFQCELTLYDGRIYKTAPKSVFQNTHDAPAPETDARN